MKFGHFIALALICSCTNVSAQENVIFLPAKQEVPANAKKLGSIKAGNNATCLHCDYGSLVETAKKKARDLGGNVVKVTALRSPTFISKCYGIKADVYRIDPLPDYGLQKTTREASSTSSAGSIYLYRLADTTLSTGYKVHVDGDSSVYYMKGRSKEMIPVTRAGTLTFWAETEKRASLKLEVSPGHDYYLRCGLKNGEIRMIPVLQQVDESLGKTEYNSIGKRKKDGNARYLQAIH